MPFAMSRTTTYSVQILWGDCDPAGIVFFPNFSKWMDAASLNFFMSCGVPAWRELERTRRIVGTPLLEIHTRFLRHATYGETLTISTSIKEWREKVFVQSHLVMRGSDRICEGEETRIFVERDEKDPSKIRGIPVPADIRALCGD